jgi:RES domain-containing protein
VNITRCSSLTQTGIHGTWYRAVDPRFLASALSTVHTATTPSRFSPARGAAAAFEILYLAENPMVALFEARALFGSPSTPGGLVPHPSRPLVTLPIVVSLGAVADLTDPAEATLIETNAQELTGEAMPPGFRQSALLHRTPECLRPELGYHALRLGLVSGFRELFSNAPGLQNSRGFPGSIEGDTRSSAVLISR